MTIEHNLENLSEKQQLDIDLAQILLKKINSLKPYNLNNTTLKYDGKIFSVVRNGFMNKFLTDDIRLALKGNLENHKDFILREVREHFKDFDLSSKSNPRKYNLNVNVNAMIEYYKDYPIYTDNLYFEDFISRIVDSIEKNLPES